MRRIVESVITPPGVCLVLLLAAGIARSKWPRAARWLFWSGLLLLWLCATPLCAGWLLCTLQTAPPLPATGPLPDAQAIVVLSAEADRHGPEFGGSTVGALTLQRVRYAAALHRRTGLPVLTSGGRPGTDLPSLAESMARVLAEEFSVEVRWREDRSADTWENAAMSKELLANAGITRVLLVTHAWHMPRARRAFERTGFEVVPAPTAFRGPAFVDASSLLPSQTAIRDTALALHELLGAAFYLFR